MQYEAVIGIEVHTHLKTRSKLFCSCSTDFDAAPNHNTCPVCLGFPGSLPVLNRQAIDYVIRTALALNCEIPDISRFARKNYYYPDLPKAYQISQYELPLGMNGWIEIRMGERRKKIRINRVHLEEDAGRLVHDQTGTSCVDYNRTSIPLMEIVTEADISNAEEATAYLTQLHSILQYIGASEGSMEKGQMRCEPNISVRPAGQEQFGTKTELKNINSFKAVYRGVEYEIDRQIKVLDDGGRIVQETRRWDDASQTTISMRSKEKAHDYRYFPDPDLVPVSIDDECRHRIAGEIPELPMQRLDRFIAEYGLPEYDAGVLTSAKPLADYYEEVVKLFGDAKKVSNWIMVEMMGLLNDRNMPIGDCKVTAESLADLLKAISNDVISNLAAKEVFKEMFETGKCPDTIIREKNLAQVSDTSALESLVVEVLSANPGPVSDYRAGKVQAIGFLTGQVMKSSGGKANPKMVRSIIEKKLAE